MMVNAHDVWVDLYDYCRAGLLYIDLIIQQTVPKLDQEYVTVNRKKVFFDTLRSNFLSVNFVDSDYVIGYHFGSSESIELRRAVNARYGAYNDVIHIHQVISPKHNETWIANIDEKEWLLWKLQK